METFLNQFFPWEETKLIVDFLRNKKPEWQTMANINHLKFARAAMKFFMLAGILGYMFSGKGIQNTLLIICINSGILLITKENKLWALKIFSVLACFSVSWARFYGIGKETAIYNQVHTSVCPIAILLLSGSYRIACFSFIYVFAFCKWNGSMIMNEYLNSPEEFQKMVGYFVNNYHVMNAVIIIGVSIIVYQHNTLLAKLWMREKEKEELLKQVQKKNELLEQLNENKTKLLLSLSHEFRNPINAALGNLELANEKNIDPAIKKYLVNCKVSIEMLFHLVSNLLDSTKLDANILELNPLPKSSKVMFHKVWSIVKNLFDKHNLVGEFYIHKRIPKMLNVDSHFVIKILLNLILNAIKFTQEGAVMTIITWIDDDKLNDNFLLPSPIFSSKFETMYTKKKKYNTFSEIHSPIKHKLSFDLETEIPLEDPSPAILMASRKSEILPSMELVKSFQNVSHNYEKLSNRQELSNQSSFRSFSHPSTNDFPRGFLKMEIYDSGRGIDDGVTKNSLFEKHSSFSQSSGDRLGVGLGLWLTKSFCEAIGGKVSVFSEKDKGSQFVAVIPVESLESSNNFEPVRSQSSPNIRPPLQLKALVVDDDKYNREIDTVFLTKADVCVKAEATNGLEAVEIFVSKPPHYFDLIVMDLEMPIMNGKESLRKIREYEHEQNLDPVKVVVATGNCDLSEYSQCMDKRGDIRADFFYRKPLTKKDFCEFVEIIQKDKSKQRTCLIIRGDNLMVEILESFLKRNKIQVIDAKSFQEAENYLLEGGVNFHWILFPLNTKEDIGRFINEAINLNYGTRIVDLIGFGDSFTTKDRAYFVSLGIQKILKAPFTYEEVNEVFNLDY